MIQVDIICKDKIYTEMLCLELEAQGYKVSKNYSGHADIVICEPEYKTGDNCIIFSEKEGADLLRPFVITELTELIEARTGDRTANHEDDKLYVSPTAGYAVCKGTRIVLSELEHGILYYLYAHRGTYVSAQRLAAEFFGNEKEINPVRVYISYLRNKFDETFGMKMIYTARGKGYMLK